MAQAQDVRITPAVSDQLMRFEPTPKWVRVMFAGEVIADSKRAYLLFERGHTPVYYFPMDDVRMDLMSRTDHRTR